MPDTYQVNTRRSNLRYRSSAGGRILGSLRKGAKVTATGKVSKGWTEVKVNGKKVWMYSGYLKKVSTAKPSVAKMAAKKPVKKKKPNSTANKQIQKANAEMALLKKNGKLGCWGKELIFEVNDRKVLMASDLKGSYSGRWQEHDMPLQTPRPEFLGAGTYEMTMTVKLSAEHGVRPRTLLEKIEKDIYKGKLEYLVIGGRVVGPQKNKMRITNMSEAWKTVYNKGELVQCNVDLTFKEYC